MNKKESEEWQKEMKRALNEAMEDRAKKQIKNDFPELYNQKQVKKRIDPYIRKQVKPITKKDVYILRLRLIFVDTADQIIQFMEDSNA